MSNRLANEKSPYLRQHSENPVNWYPWCGEAFEAARANDQPVFLSIGYSTCHWCHVMAHESFESDEVAALLNREFVCIKVDREERPDIDAVYMRACEVLTGAGGWPLTIVMTADQKPFFAGTYFPKNDRYGQPGLFSLLREISAMWKSDRDTLLHAAVQLTSALREAAHQSEAPSRTRIDEALASLRKSFDSRHGGFGGAPKFPAAHNLLFLMTVDETGMAMAERTLRAMARGGIFDQIGGGFSRYSTDEKWLVPHFEKMLYDNALLLWAYAEAYRKTSANVFADIARRTADYMLRELKAPEGGFFAGQDADSDGVEGGYYTLTPNEVRGMIGEEDGEAFCRLYGIGERKNIPNLIVSDEAPWPADDPRLKKLYDARRSRAKLHLDDKILLSWNAWAIIALTESAVILGASAYLDSAKGIVQFIESKMTDPENRLYLRWCRGEAAHAGQLDDYAAYALALLRLYRATFDIQYLELSVLRAEQMLRCFADDAGGFFQTAHDAEKLIDRPKETYDGAVPSGNSSAAMVLETLARLTGERKWREAADCQIRYIAGAAARYPAGHCFSLLAMHRALQPERLLVACSSSLPQELREIKLPADLPVLFRSGENAAQLAKLAPFTVDYPVPAAGTTWYLCENGACQTPTADFAELPL